MFQLKAFAKEHNENAEAFASAISNAEENVEWGENRIVAISSWLEARAESSGGKSFINVSCLLAVLLLMILIQ